MTPETLIQPVAIARWGTSVRRLAAISVLGLACAAAYWVGSVSSSAPPNAGLRIPADRLHFGQTWQNISFPWDLPIENPGTERIVIERFSTSCQCLSLEPTTLTLAPGERATLRLSLDLTRFLRGTGEVKDFGVKIVPHIQGSVNLEPGWTIEGRVRDCLSLPIATVDFGYELVQGESFPSRPLKVLAHAMVKELSAVNNQKAFTVKAVHNNEREFELQITPQAGVGVGYFASEIEIEAILSDGTRSTAARAGVKGMVRRPVGFVPEALHLGIRTVGDFVMESVALRSLKGQRFSVVDVRTVSLDTQVTPTFTTTAEPAAQFTIKTLITHEGPHKDELLFTVRREMDDTPMTIPLLVSYHGKPTKSNSTPHSLATEKNP